MIERIKTFFLGHGAAGVGQGVAGAATVHFCVHPCPEHLAMAVVFWVVGIVASIKGRF